METITSTIETVVGWFEIIPLKLWSIILGLMLSLLFTQFVKRILPISQWCKAEKSERIYRLILRLIAFFVAFIATYATWPADPFRVFIAISVGLASPVFYLVGTSIAYQIWFDLERKLSGHP